MKAHTPASKIVTASLITILAKLGGILKVSFIFGSCAALFSASSMLQPLSGAFGGILGSTTFLVIGMMIRVLTGSVLSFKILAYHIPGFFASAYWAGQSKWLSIAVPVVCMALFLAHPVGLAAAPYALYWLIPVVIALLPMLEKYNIPFINPFVLSLRRISPNKSIFLTSLSSTFIAHAVGSVIWIYAAPATPAFWYALIPMVAVERFVMACGMTLAYHAIAKIIVRFAALRSYVAGAVGV